MGDGNSPSGSKPSPRQKPASSSLSYNELEKQLRAARKRIAELEKTRDPEETEKAMQGVWQALKETGGLAPSKIEEVIRDIRRRGVRMVEE